MKTAFYYYLILLIAFTSCNPAKRYANYRYGGRTKHESKIQPEEEKTNSLVEANATEICNDTLSSSYYSHDTTSVSVLEKTSIIKTVVQKNDSKMVLPSNTENVKNNESKNQATAKKKSIREIHSKNQNFSPTTSTDGTDVLYALGIILIIGAGVLALVAAGVSLLEILYFALAMIGVVILLYYIGEAFMNIFPGMSKETKKPINPKFQKIIRPFKKTISGMMSYDGISIGLYFLLGLAAIALVGLVVFLFFTWTDALLAMAVLLGIHLGILLLLGIGYALIYICTGGMMSIQKKSKNQHAMKSSDTHYLKYILGGILIAGALWLFTGSWPIALAFLSGVVLCKLVELIIDLFEGKAFGRMIGNIFRPKKGATKMFAQPEEKKKWKKILSDLFNLLVWLAILALLAFLVSLGSLSIFESLLLVLGIGIGLAVIFLYIIGGIEKFVRENHN